jgi:paired amphipathic helix protein Sin3a
VSGGAQSARQPVEFDYAIQYVTKIKNRCSSKNPRMYRNFLDILHDYQTMRKTIHEVYQSVGELFVDCPDLLEEFKRFLPMETLDTTSSTVADSGKRYGTERDGRRPDGVWTPAPGPVRVLRAGQRSES